jgi:hypothetical protein
LIANYDRIIGIIDFCYGTQGNLGAEKITRSRFQSPVKKKITHWQPTAISLL